MTNENERTTTDATANGTESVDVLVVGGGAAGLSGATALARSRRSVLVVDAGEPRNAPAAGVHNFLTRDGTPPAELMALGRAEVARYGGRVLAGRVTAVTRDGEGDRPAFTATADLADGGHLTVRARRLLVTTGLVDGLPEIPGLRERWGRDVLHCPYCHGWEVRDQPVGILATGPMAVHQALLFRQLTDDVILFTHTAPPLAEADAERLAARGITVVDDEVTALEVTDDQLTAVRLRGGGTVPRRALVVSPRFTATAGVLATLGLTPTEHPMGVGEAVTTSDPTGRTTVPGVWVAGNITDLMAQVVGAAAAGLMAGAAINTDLIEEETAAAVAAHRAATPAAAGR